MRPCSPTHKPCTQDGNLARETEKMFAVQICWGCFVAEVHSFSATFLGLEIERSRSAATSTMFGVLGWYTQTGHVILSIRSQSVGP